MRRYSVPVGLPLGVAAFGFGCAMGAIAGLPCLRAGMLYALLLVQTVTCIACAGLWRYAARWPPARALLLEAAVAAVTWGAVLATLGWSCSSVLVLAALVWLELAALLGTALRRARDRTHVARAAALFVGPLAAGLCAGIMCAAVSKEPLSVEKCLVATLLLSMGATAVGVAVQGVRAWRDRSRRSGEDGLANRPKPSDAGERPVTGEVRPAGDRIPAGGGTPADGDGPQAFQVDPTDFDIACADLAEAFGLSAREQEVFSLLARGYRSPHIAQELCTAETTVRTHAQHIYRKMSVRTADQVIQIVERRTAAVHAARCREYAERIRRIDLLLQLRGDTRWPTRRRGNR